MSEKSKKYLWIAIAVSAFALIVIGGAYLFFPPESEKSSAPLSLGGDVEAKPDQAVDFLANEPAVATQTTTQSSSGDIIIVYGNEPSANQTTATTAPTSATISVSTTTTLAPRPVQTPAPTTTTTVKPVTTQAKPATTSTTVKPATTVKSTSTTVKPAAPSSGEWWIQAGLFGSKPNATALQTAIASKNLPAQIAERIKDGATLYQVRVGPYPSSEEARKWLASVKSVKGAEAAWLTQ